MIPDVPVTDELLHALPKTDLHCHLDGSLRLSTVLALAEEQGIRLPADTEDGLAKSMKLGERHGSLEEYLKGFDITLSVLQTEDALYRAAYELVREVLEGDRCQLLEALAQRSAERLLTLEQVRRATVTVRKRPPLPAAIGSVGVEVTRGR